VGRIDEKEVSLSAGARLGPYEILSPLGAGGMGEVYRARDTRLKRDVAVKTLSEELSRDAEHLERFQREAEALAAMNHPGIAGIYGIEETADRRYLVLELVSGETLEQRLAAGALPQEQALEIGRQIADALASAHEKGIVHRDLKPGNVMITPEGRVKLLDFGLAKNVPFEQSASDSVAPTIASSTRVGSILGTLAYMSPEQARGRELDRRTDVWSFGCVLYEMFTGRRAFEGQTPPDILVSVLEREPDWHALPRAVPETIRHLLRRCLEKDPGRRLRDAGDARLDIEEVIASRRKTRPGAGRSLAIGAIVALLAAAAAIVFVTRRRGEAPQATAMPRLTQLTTAEGIEESPAFSPDGRALAYAAESGGRRKIFLRSLSSGESRRLTSGDFDDVQPAWSQDGKSVLFVRSREPRAKLEPGDVFGWYTGGDVWQIDVASGRELRLVENAFNPSVSPDGSRIAVDASWAGPRRIWTVDTRGLNAQQMTTDVSEAVAHYRPRWSPDGRKIVFQNQESTKFDVRMADVRTKEIEWVTNDVPRDIHPAWSSDGRFIYFSSDRGGGLNLWRIPVSAEGKTSGKAQQVTTGAGQDVDTAVSRDGKRLAFTILKINADLWRVPVSPETGKPDDEPREVVATTREDSRGAWSSDGRQIAFNSDRAGDMNIWIAPVEGVAARQLTRGPGGDFQPNWSPDGSRIAFFSSRSGNADIWTVDVASGKLAQLTRAPSIEINPFFSPNGTSIAYQSDETGRSEVWMMRADGSGPRRLTGVGAGGHFLRWSADGTSVFFRCLCGGQPRVMSVPVDGGEPKPTAQVAGGSHISFSPDASKILDVVAHKALWISPLTSGSPSRVFEFPDPDVRIDYPVWSPTGGWVLFDRFRPQGGDIWSLEEVE
jgi:Tol biopolymer transport system component